MPDLIGQTLHVRPCLGPLRRNAWQDGTLVAAQVPVGMPPCAPRHCCGLPLNTHMPSLLWTATQNTHASVRLGRSSLHFSNLDGHCQCPCDILTKIKNADAQQHSNRQHCV